MFVYAATIPYDLGLSLFKAGTRTKRKQIEKRGVQLSSRRVELPHFNRKASLWSSAMYLSFPEHAPRSVPMAAAKGTRL
jgi:hypothetical protein